MVSIRGGTSLPGDSEEPAMTSLRLLSFSMMLFCVGAQAQDAAASGAFAGLISVTTALKATVSSKDAKVGQAVTVTLESPATVSGTVLPRGTVLEGHVVNVTRHSKETPDGSLSIIFDQAKPKKSEPVNIVASIFKIMPSENMRLSQHTDLAAGMRGEPGTDLNTARLSQSIDKDSHTSTATQSAPGAPVQVVSFMPDIALSAVAGGSSSGIMTAKNKDVELPLNMNMVIGVSLKR